MEYFFGRMDPRRLKVLQITLIGQVIERIDDQHLDICFSPITWSNKQQPIVAIGFIEVEYRSLAKRLKESTWPKKLTTKLGISKEATKIWCGNMSNLKIDKNPILHARTKHVEVHYHYVHE
jgi:hypothetical protein